MPYVLVAGLGFVSGLWVRSEADTMATPIKLAVAGGLIYGGYKLYQAKKK